MFAILPHFGIGAVPGTARAALSVLIALLLYPVVEVPTVVQSTADLFTLVVGEVAVGLSIGLVIVVFLGGIGLGGEVVGIQMGVGAATALDPRNDFSLPVVANFYQLIALATWFALEGHLALLHALGETYEILPVGGIVAAPKGLSAVVALGSTAFEAAIQIAAPVIVAILVVNVTMALLARMAPEMNVFLAAIPITIGLGLLVIGLSLPGAVRFVSVWTDMLSETISDLVSTFR